MAKNLTNSQYDRQNVLNNRYALEKLEEHLDLGGIFFEDNFLFTKQQLVSLFQVGERTIEQYLTTHGKELRSNGYQVLKGSKLKQFKALADVSAIDYGDISKTPALGVFTFRAVLNMAMLLTESEQAKFLRSRILDIVIDVMAERAGGHTKYINQRDSNYLTAAYSEFGYREVFTNALNEYLEMRGGKAKFGIYTDKIYQLVFRENAKEYRQVLRLAKKDRLRDTLYAEVLKAIASIENGLAEEMKLASERLERKLTPQELDEIISNVEKNPYLKPIIEDARIKMASRDLCFRDALHQKLEAYVQSVPEADFEKFLGETTRSLEEQLSSPETLAVFERLKDR
ncbi:hypothetical protein NIES4102_03750 [Chondrocystis sp. NIES-4102]|nr:hypothetical protein NIES4102_03750 [Chondrocystis sp. NIES-4102]